jgi:hypothetical protein
VSSDSEGIPIGLSSRLDYHLHLVPSREEPAHAFNDVLVDATVCLAPRAVAKVVGPASQ